MGRNISRLWTETEKIPSFYYGQISPEQIAQDQAGIKSAEQSFLDTWGNQSNVNSYNMPANLDPVTRALTAFNASTLPYAFDEWNPKVAPVFGSDFGEASYGKLLGHDRDALTYTGYTPEANPGDMHVDPAQHNLFMNYSRDPLNASTVDWYSQTPSQQMYYPKHVTGIDSVSGFTLKPLSALLSIAGAGMGGMLAPAAGAGASAGAGAGALSASEAAGYGGIAASSAAAPAATTGVTSAAPSMLSTPTFESGAGGSYFATGNGLTPTSGSASGVSQGFGMASSMPDAFNVAGTSSEMAGGGGAATANQTPSGMGSVMEGGVENMTPSMWDQAAKTPTDWWDKIKGVYTDYVKPASPLFQIGSQALKSKGQANMMEDLARAQSESYNSWTQNQNKAYGDYINTLTPMFQGYQDQTAKAYQDWLSTLNPPEDVKQTRLAQAEAQVRSNSSEAQRRLQNTLAARGIRGQGTAAPQAAQEKATQEALNQAYQQVYGQYNVPSQPYTPPVSPLVTGQVKPPALTNQTPPPVNYAPSFGDLMGQNIGDLGTILSILNGMGK